MAEDKFADETMSDEELEGVAGGNCYESADDSRFLNSLNGSTDRYGERRIAFTPGTSIEEEIQRGWKTVGIDFEWRGGGNIGNHYRLNGREISQEQARQHAMKVTGKQMTESDWKW
ncbi:MAG: hypothetical protein J5809_08000 [Selenomonadaceae bacterium]|nr:hypothetical protein [Selenomonadaceae bacterium]